MPLFDVPGWSVTAEPVTDNATRKRKRNSEDSEKKTGGDVNFDKLVRKLTGKQSGEPKKSKSKKRPSHEEKKNSISLPKPLKASSEKNASTTSVNQPPPKKVKTKHVAFAAQEAGPSGSTTKSVKPSGLTDMQTNMRQSLNGARFRMINESLYKTSSAEAHSMMQDDESVFEEYHTGFRYQVQSWPTNPVEKYIEVLSSAASKTVVADLGCGDAALARSLLPKGLVVLSFDLISTNPFVVAADICDKIPLPGSEPDTDDKSDGDAHIVDVVVCALSLMGTNWPSCIRESWRILRAGGELKIAEVASRFVNVKQFVSLISSIGFRLSSKDDSNTHFTMFEFKKIARSQKSDEDWANILQKGSLLKPCEYKRR